MKFILQEDKFILTEDTKFILEERFRLNEADRLTEATAAELAQKWTTQLSKTFVNVEAVLKKYIEYINLSKADTKLHQKNTELAARLKELTDEFEITLRQPLKELNTNITEVKTDLQNYITILNNILTSVTETEKNKTSLLNLQKLVTTLSRLHGLSALTDANIKTLKQAVSQSIAIIESLLDVSEIEKNNKKIQEFKESCNHCLELLETLKDALPTDFTDAEEADLVEYQTIVKELIDITSLKDAATLNRGLVIANFAKYQTQVEAIIVKYNQLLDANLFTKKARAKDKEKHDAEMAAISDQKDWKTKFAQAANKEAVIKEFIYTTWKAAGPKVMEIKDSVMAECETYGFTSDGDGKNPFISFITNVYLNYTDVFTPTKYNVIHNLAAQKYLTGEDLAGTGKMGKGNLVFCKDFYKLEPDVMKLYVRKQSNLLHAAQKPNIFSSNEEMTFNILYKLTKVTLGADTQNSTTMSLRAMTDIEQLESKWTGKISDTTNSKADKKKVASNAELIEHIADTTAAVKVIVALAIKFSTNSKIIAAAQSCKEAKQLMSETTTIEDIRKLVASVENFYKIESINATQALSLITSILDSDKFSLTKE